jgi:hypothetical protein
MNEAIAIWAAVAALCGVAGTLVASRRSPEAGFGGMSIAGRGLLWSSAGAFITAMVQASIPGQSDDALLLTLGLSAGLLVSGLVLYTLGQKSDGSAAWHDSLAVEVQEDPETERLKTQRRYDNLP